MSKKQYVTYFTYYSNKSKNYFFYKLIKSAQARLQLSTEYRKYKHTGVPL